MCGGGGNTFVLWLTLLAFAAAAILATNVPQSAQAQSDDNTSGRIVARLLDDGRVEFGWQPTGGERVLPRQRYFPTNAQVDRWLRSSPVEVDGVEIGRINARLLDDGRIEFGFTPTDGERILTRARYFPTNAQVNRWLRSTEITISLAEDAPGFTAVSAGGGHTCGLRSTGAIECWGDNSLGQTDAPEGTFTAVSAGVNRTCAIRDTGEIACWGINGGGQADVPEGMFTAVGTGVGFTCGLRESGELECWGGIYGSLSPPAPVTHIAISVGQTHVCILLSAGGIACVGNNDYGQTDAPVDSSFTAVSAGFWHTCAIRENREIACWGSNDFGQTDAPEGSNFSAISAGRAHTCAVRDTGEIVCWGSNETYSFDEDMPTSVYAGQIDAPEGSFTAVSAGYAHTCGLRDDGSIECWGWNDGGQTDAPAE